MSATRDTIRGVGKATRPKGGGHLRVGESGEEAALRWYLDSGHRLVARNWRCAIGEIDLILEHGPTLIFCEVKTRRGSRLGGPFEAVTATKQHKVRLLAEAFLAQRRPRHPDLRFDVASVSLHPDGRPSVHVFEGAF